jgi:uncharacterized protein YcbK (DUF882 family)
VPLGIARPNIRRIAASRAGYSCGLALFLVLFGCRGLQNAVADGDTRTISMRQVHTNENITITYKREGRYDEAALEKLNWFLRDWRRGKETRMDPHLIDLLWEVQRETGSKEPIYVVCGYRSPATNAMLRRTSRGVARYSQHILGHAVDFYIPGVPLEELRVIGLRMQRGGVGFYPTSGSPFVHVDTGGVRMWPRMTRDQLLHVFPDGRTVYLPKDGHPLPGYALALAELRKRGQNPTETWTEEAREEGLSKNIILASNERQADPYGQFYGMTRADREADAREAARTPPPVPSAVAVAMNALHAALEREAQRRRDEARLAAAAPSGNAGALYQLASYTPPAGGMTPSQIVNARGDWQNASDAEPAAASGSDAGVQLASAADLTSSIAAWGGALQDHVPARLMLAYSALREQTAPAAALSTTPVVEAQADLPQPPAATTIVEKRAADQAVSTIIAAPPRLAASEGARFDNPWLDALMISPSVRRYLTVLMLGTPDYRALAALVEKPASSVMMTFAAEPNPGMTSDRFSGSAIVFMSTVTYQAPMHTAWLQ